MAASTGLSPAEYQALLNKPVASPPPGYQADLDQGPANLEGAIVFVVLGGIIGTLSVGIGLFTKLYIMKKPSWADLATAVGYSLFITYLVTGTFAVVHGSGKHIWNFRYYQFIDFLYYLYVAEIVYDVANIFIKISILMQYRELFCTKARTFTWWATHVLIAMVAIYYSVITFCRIFACTPVSKSWDVLDQTGSCLNTASIQTAAAVYNACSDFLILLIPQGVIWKLQLPLRRKLGISAVFLIGIIACISSSFRSYYAVQLLWSKDFPHAVSQVGWWTVAEVFCGVLCASLPSIPRFFQFIGVNKHALSFKTSIRSLLRGKGSRPGSLNTDTDVKPFASYEASNRTLSNKKGYTDLDEQELPTLAGKNYGNGRT